MILSGIYLSLSDLLSMIISGSIRVATNGIILFFFLWLSNIWLNVCMGIPDHLTCLLRNLYADQKATVRTGHGRTDWFQIGKGVRQGCILSPCIFNPLPATQEKTVHMDIIRWSTPKSDWLYSLQPKMENLYTVSKNKTGSWLWLRSWTPYCQI